MNDDKSTKQRKSEDFWLVIAALSLMPLVMFIGFGAEVLMNSCK